MDCSAVDFSLVPDMPVSARIRARLAASGAHFRANDNIAAYLRQGELDELRNEVANALQEVLRALVIDVEHDHNTEDTAKRVSKMFVDEVFRGRFQDAPKVTSFPNVSGLNELMVIGPIAVRSACSHHLCPIIGRVWIGVMPNAGSELIGLSKYARIADWILSRPQIQEEAVVMLADELEQRIRPDGLAVLMQADHFCMHWRGVKDDQSQMTNIVTRGSLQTNPDLRREFLGLCQTKRG